MRLSIITRLFNWGLCDIIINELLRQIIINNKGLDDTDDEASIGKSRYYQSLIIMMDLMLIEAYHAYAISLVLPA